MRARRQICLSCHHDFTRRWNAERHNYNIHGGRAKIIPIHDFIYGPVRYRPNSTNYHDTDSSLREEATRDVLVQMVEEIGEEFEALDREAQTLPPDIKNQVLGFAVFNAVFAPNTKESMQDSRKTLRTSASGLLGKMIKCVASSMSISPAAAQEMLRNILQLNRARRTSNGNLG
ncbi:MAG: hypothetical protein ACRD4W_05385 [Nitrososphaeraceae archaeon]